jgi:bifunctional UDP-N-acetylglucosamine pyrophosphorylase/glucosamine-1-phosphate N-acetyltransferase
MGETSLYVVVLAAGMGTRMKSSRAKVLHPVGNKAMLGHVLDLASSIGASGCSVVVGPEMDEVRALIQSEMPEASIFEQTERLGTAHAVLAAKEALQTLKAGYVLVLYGDTPLMTKAALEGLINELEKGAAVGVLGFDAVNPTGYGRLIRSDEGGLEAIVEEKDASDEQRRITICNSGVMGFKAAHMLPFLDQISNDNANGEYYLTDAVHLARQAGHSAIVSLCDEDDVLGVNDRVQLSEAEAIFQRRAREAAQRNGATLIAPETVFFSADTKIGLDVLIEPNVFFGPGVTVADNVTIHGFSHLEGANLSEGVVIGPYARLRPGAELMAGAKVGNFCEVKKAHIGAGAKVNHLTYIGDAEVGANANIGAGTITCNYDGFFKHKTIIGEGCFVGSNSSLIAPVTLGAGSYIGSGSVISEGVPEDALVVTRAKARMMERWAARYRRSQQRKKDALTKG